MTETRNYFTEVYDEQKPRNARARELRREGWSVECETASFVDLARIGNRYFLLAVREGYTGPVLT